MLWFSIWFMLILKLPIVYLAYVIWWAVKDPPEPSPGPWLSAAEPGDGGGGVPGPERRRLPRHPLPGRRPGPHGTPVRRPLPQRVRERVAAK